MTEAKSRTLLKIIAGGVLCFGIIFGLSTPPKPTVNVYNWYSMIPVDVLKDFEKETGVHVVIDYYDSNDLLEAKLLAGHSGYDVVFPSASPYLGRQIVAGVYQHIDFKKIPNALDLEPELVSKMRTVDPFNQYSIPYYWGTVGIAYNQDMIKSRFPLAPTDSYRMLFDEEVVSRFKDCGVTLLEESVDVYPNVLMYLGKDLQSTSVDDLIMAQKSLMRIRPYIRRFSGSRIVGELANGETCVAQAWSGDAALAAHEGASLGRTIKYTIPKEGTGLWVDAVAIPMDAPHPDYAHTFINFILRPDIAARISLATKLAVPTRTGKHYLPKDIQNNENLFPSNDVMARLALDQHQPMDYERKRNHLWTDFRLNRHVDYDAHA